MGVFPGFGGWINQNSTQQPLNAESKRSENVKSKSAPKMDPNKAPAKSKVNNDKDEERKQDNLWNNAEKKHPWYDPPPRVKVTTKKGLCHMNIELTLGMTPDGVYNLFTNPQNMPLFLTGNGGQLLKNISRKVLKNNGPRQIAKLKKNVAWDFLGWSGSIPINLIVDENKNDFTAKYKKEKMMFMKVFEGNWKIEPLFVDQERLCKHILPKNREEYKQCSDGQGKIGSKVTMDQYFEPYPPFNMPPFSWYIREITVKTTKTLLQMLQNRSVIYREVPLSSQTTKS